MAMSEVKVRPKWCFDIAAGKGKEYEWVAYGNDVQEMIMKAREANDVRPIRVDLGGTEYIIYPHGPVSAAATRKKRGVGIKAPVQIQTASGWQRQIAFVEPTTHGPVVDEEPPRVKEELEEGPTKRRRTCYTPAVDEDREDDGGHMWKRITAWTWGWKEITCWVESRD